jgi:hypothetical protein
VRPAGTVAADASTLTVAPTAGSVGEIVNAATGFAAASTFTGIGLLLARTPRSSVSVRITL